MSDKKYSLLKIAASDGSYNLDFGISKATATETAAAETVPSTCY
jgi:hypothetical protein